MFASHYHKRKVPSSCRQYGIISKLLLTVDFYMCCLKTGVNVLTFWAG